VSGTEDAGEPDPGQQTLNRESHPNAGGPEGLAGDLGLSSERTDGFEGVEGTGSLASTQGHTEGESPTTRVDLPEPDEEAVDKPDDTSPASGVDRTVGEVQPDEVADKHPFDPDRNPGH
jgi:hypothetical protein